MLNAGNIIAQDCDIPMSVVIEPEFSHMTPEAGSALQSQLERLSVQSGLDVGWKNSKFAITAKFDQIDRFILGSAPTQIANVFGVTLYIADIYNQKLFSSTYLELRGVGTTETKASMNAVRQLNANNSKVSSFLYGTKTKIVNYYDSQLDNIIKDARNKASMKNYGEALAMLAVVPTCCNGYQRAMKEALKIYYLYRDTYFLSQLNKARALWAANPTIEGSTQVVEILATIDPDARCYNDAMSLLTQVAKVVKTDIDYETKKKYEDAIELEKLRIKAIEEIGKAYAANRPVNIMFLGHGHGTTVTTDRPVSDLSGAIPLSDNSTKMSGSDIFKKYDSAVFTVVVPSTDGTMTSQGSGFFIDDKGKAVTNFHVLDGGNLNNASILLPQSNTSYSISKILKANKDNDYVVFLVNCSGNNYIPMASRKPNVGDKVYAIGSPKGLQNTFSSGEVSQWRGANVIQTTVMIDHGSSGGALINEQGQVVGITSGTFDSTSSANLNYAMSIDVIK